MSFTNCRGLAKKLLLLGLIFFIFLAQFPQTVTATGWPVVDVLLIETVASGVVPSSGTTAGMTTAEKILFYVLNTVAWTAAKRIVQGITAQTVNWINSGFKGNPAYVTDPGQFFLDVGDNVASQVLSNTRLNALCSPFRAQVRLALVKNYLTDNQNYTCTLSKIKDNYDQFTQNFSQGGWDGWLEVTQSSQGNPYGSFFAARNQLGIEIGTQQNHITKQLEQGKGFLSFQKCKASSVMGSQEAAERSSDEGVLYKAGDCRSQSSNDNEVVTPGSVIESQLELAVGTGVRQLELADSFNEIVSALVNDLYKRVVGGLTSGGVGLRGASNTVPVPPATPESIPFIILQGESPMEVQLNSVFKDPGALGFSETGGDISNQVIATGIVDTSVVGTTTIKYTLTYNGKSAIPVERVVIVVGTVANTAGCPAGISILAENGPPPSYERNVQSASRAALAENPNLASAPREDIGVGTQLVQIIVDKLRAQGFIAGWAVNCFGSRHPDENMIVGKISSQVMGQNLGEFYSLFRVEAGITYQEASNKRNGGEFVEYADYPRCKEGGC